MPGHILVSTESLFRRAPLIKESWGLDDLRIKVGLQPIPYQFLYHGGKIYYVNGRKQIYETDIVKTVKVLFDPVGYQLLDDMSWHPIQFRLMEKVEWIFL
ncbi:MAG: hypothetical protein EB075_09330 [Bacteroidetes bacterium]|nr:hypothetical protein [Bacteroidota bacterium]